MSIRWSGRTEKQMIRGTLTLPGKVGRCPGKESFPPSDGLIHICQASTCLVTLWTPAGHRVQTRSGVSDNCKTSKMDPSLRSEAAWVRLLGQCMKPNVMARGLSPPRRTAQNHAPAGQAASPGEGPREFTRRHHGDKSTSVF